MRIFERQEAEYRGHIVMCWVGRRLIINFIARISKGKMASPFFSGAVAVGSKGGLMVPGATSAVGVTMWAVTASVQAATSSMPEDTASMSDVQVTCGMLRHLCGLL